MLCWINFLKHSMRIPLMNVWRIGSAIANFITELLVHMFIIHLARISFVTTAIYVYNSLLMNLTFTYNTYNVRYDFFSFFRPCHTCGEFRHWRQECPNKKKLRCRFCFQMGHSWRNCDTRLFWQEMCLSSADKSEFCRLSLIGGELY